MERQINEIKHNLRAIQELAENSKSMSHGAKKYIKQKCKTALMDLEVLHLQIMYDKKVNSKP